MGHVLDILNDIRDQIAADPDVLKEARDRRDLVAEASMDIDGALGWFRSGSVAHGTTNAPVTDADSGIILDRRTYPTLGPDGDDEGPEDIVDEIGELVGPKVREKYPKAKVKRSRRGLLVEFNDPLDAEQDPTVDHIVTLTRKDADGLWIPDLEKNEWSASHPEKHTDLFTSGSKALKALRARTVRLAKAWNKQWDEGDRALSSFNIGALGWEYIDDESAPLDEALAGWFAYARDQINQGETKDPAGVSEPIRLPLTKEIAVERLGAAAGRMKHALENDDDEDIVREDLSHVFPDYVTAPTTPKKKALAAALREGNQGIGATRGGIAVGTGTAMKTTRSFGGERDA